MKPSKLSECFFLFSGSFCFRHEVPLYWNVPVTNGISPFFPSICGRFRTWRTKLVLMHSHMKLCIGLYYWVELHSCAFWGENNPVGRMMWGGLDALLERVMQNPKQYSWKSEVFIWNHRLFGLLTFYIFEYNTLRFRDSSVSVFRVDSFETNTTTR